MPAGYDAEVAELFRDLRSASNLSEAELAARLATRVEVVQALEQGALYALPPWAETYRVVNNYGLLLNLDVRPLLRRIYAQVEAGIVGLRPKPMPDVPVMAGPEMADFEFPVDEGTPAQAQYAPVPQPQPRRLEPAPAPDRRLQPRQGPGPAPQAYPPQAYPQQQGQPQRQRQPHPQQALAPQGRPQPQQPQPPPQASPEPVSHQAKGPEPRSVSKRAKRTAGRPVLLKWGVVLLIVSGLAFGLWMLLAEPDLTGLSATNPSGQPLDPDDPRSRKADRLPSPF